MIQARPFAILTLLAASTAAVAQADETRYFEEGGIRYQETTQVMQRPITETRYEPRESTGYRERYTTDMQEVQRSYQVPVTEQQWVPGYQRTWNLLAPPVLSYRQMPVTRWETRTETVRIPVTKKEYSPEKQVTQVPVTNTRISEERIVRRVALGPATGGPTSTDAASVARNEPPAQLGGRQLDNDPPREQPADIDRRK